VKARIVQIAFNLMSPVGKSIWQDALHAKDDQVREMARTIAHEHHWLLNC
jgi:hypothetical protein